MVMLHNLLKRPPTVSCELFFCRYRRLALTLVPISGEVEILPGTIHCATAVLRVLVR